MLRATPRQFPLQVVPSHGVRAVVFEIREAAFKLGCLSGREREILVGQAIPKLLDETQPFPWRKARNFIRRQLHTITPTNGTTSELWTWPVTTVNEPCPCRLVLPSSGSSLPGKEPLWTQPNSSASLPSASAGPSCPSKDVFAAHPHPEAVDILVQTYEYGPCSSNRCRAKNVNVFHSLGALPEWIIAECRHDANFDPRRQGAGY